MSGLNVAGVETSITLFNLFCSNVSKQDARVCSPFNHAIVYQLMIRFVFIILLSFTNDHPRELLCPNSLSGAVWV